MKKNLLVVAGLAFLVTQCGQGQRPKPVEPVTQQGGDGGQTPSGEAKPVWHPLPTANAPDYRKQHTAVWAGDRMIVFGGIQIPIEPEPRKLFPVAGVYHAEQRAWAELPAIPTEEARFAHSSVWTGTELLVWGGAQGSQLKNGWRYSAQKGWSEIPASAATPEGRYNHTAVWTGNKMMVWGGQNLDLGTLNTGYLFNPSSNQWQPVTSKNTPAARWAHSMTWMESRTSAAVWGGFRSNDGTAGTWNNGGIYNVLTDDWDEINEVGAPSTRAWHTAVWTGNRLMVWGGRGGQMGSAPLDDGAIYNPSNGKWLPMSSTNAPSPRFLHTAVWTGKKMIVYGGQGYGKNLGDGGVYDPATDTWEALPASGSPAPRNLHTAIWTGSEMIVYGGIGNEQVPGEKPGTFVAERLDGGILRWEKAR